MIWVWAIFTLFLFYFFTILQNSFFAYFNLLGQAPNFVFIIFFVFIFFTKKNYFIKTLFLSLWAGILLDAFSINPIGVSIVLLAISGLAIKKVQILLKEKENNYPIIQFAFMFVLAFIFYCFGIKLSYYFIGIDSLNFELSYKFILGIIYNLSIALIIFCLADIFIKPEKPKHKSLFL
jgi:rod shape-determining protein MreD